MNEPMTFLDFFSGVGGFRKDFELCGMVCKGHCEIDKFADRSYRAIHDVKEDEWYGEDITKTDPADLPRVNLWAGGFPCQDISVSGRQRGLAGKRSSLFFEIVRLLKGSPLRSTTCETSCWNSPKKRQRRSPCRWSCSPPAHWIFSVTKAPLILTSASSYSIFTALVSS